MTLIQEFADQFEKLFEARLNIKSNTPAEFRTYLGHGADKTYKGSLEISNTKLYNTKRKIKYTVELETAINPAGISGDHDIGRTFTIDFDVMSNNNKQLRFPDFYSYARNIDDVLVKFDEYLTNKLNIKPLSKEEIQFFNLQKSSRKYNL
jgi:hypothetical protein